MTTPAMSMPSPARRPQRIAFPLVLIALGFVLLLANLGYLAGVTWQRLLPLWPVLLVLWGVDLLLRSRSLAAAVLVDIAIVAAVLFYLLSLPASSIPAPGAYSTDLPRGGATALDLTVNYGAGSLVLAGGGGDLVSVRSTREDVTSTLRRAATSATVSLSSGPSDVFAFDGFDRRWEVRVPSDVRTALTLNLGAGDFDIDLGDVRLAVATINAGASDLKVRLPAPTGDVPITISAGASDITIDVPSGAAYRITTTGAMHSLSGATESPDYGAATDRLTIRLSVGMSSVTIR